MNDNKNPKKFSTLSEQLSDIFEHMDYIHSSFSRIEAYAKKKYEDIETEVNPENSSDVSRELQYHIANFLRNLACEFDKKNGRIN